MSSFDNLYIKDDFTPSKHLIEKRQANKRKRYINYLLTLNKNNTLPFFEETNPVILNNKDLFRKAFTYYPTLVKQISLKMPKSFYYDTEFMLEMYHITKSTELFNETKPKRLFFELFKIDSKFFNSDIQHFNSDIKFMCECISVKPGIVSNRFVPEKIKHEFEMIKSSIETINSVKTFLLCIQKNEGNVSWLKRFPYQVMEICEYLKPPLYPVYLFIENSSNLKYKCMRLHTCEHCDIKNKLEEYIKNLEYTSNKFIKYRILEKIKQLEPKLKKSTLCTKNTFCKKCPNFEDRKQWIDMIRTKAKSVYRLKVI